MKREAMIERLRSRLGIADRPERTLRPEAPGVREPGGGEAAIERFKAKLAAQGAEVVEIAALADLPRWLAGTLAGRGHGLRIAVGEDARFRALDWGGIALAPASALRDGAVTIGLTHAYAGVAETGSLLIASGPETPLTTAILSEFNVVAVAARQVFARYESAFCDLRESGELPRAVTLVSGPSRTGDIGGRIVLGAHGPRRLAAVIYR